ncbi:MAG TPA: PilZ domain-containing protein [Rhizomicrobium sp.]|nr:PilZ domain-containing protein [Rhizomicrobium sp.]
MPIPSEKEQIVRAPERRRIKRSAVCLAGQLFCAERSTQFQCVVQDISPGGAAIECLCDLQKGATVVLYAGALGRFEGQIVARNGKRVAIRFDHSERMRGKIAEKIMLHLEGKLEARARLRTAPRMNEPALRTFTRRDGTVIDCDVADISLTGASLKTDIRPPIGEIIHIGRSAGRVVRHHDEGIAVEFLYRDVFEPSAKNFA